MTNIKAPFFEIGPKSYLYGDQILELAQAADAASDKYQAHPRVCAPHGPHPRRPWSG